MLEERQFVGVAHGQAMRPVEVRDPARRIDIALIVVRGIECRVSGRSSINVFRERVRRLEVTLVPAPRHTCLQRVVSRVRVIGEQLISAIAVQPGRRRSCDRIGEGVGRDCLRVARAVGNRERMLHRIHRLDCIPSLAQVNTSCAHITHVHDPALADFPLDGKVPLLRIGHHEVPRNFQHKQVLGRIHPRPRAPAVGGSAIRIRKAGQLRQAGQPCPRKLSSRRHCIRIHCRRSREKIRQVESLRRSEEHDRDKRRLKAQLIHCSHVLANVVDSIAPAYRGRMPAHHIPGKAHPRAPSRRDVVLKRRTLCVSGQSRNAQLVHALGINERIRARVRQVRLDVADVAVPVSPRPQKLRPQSQVDREVRSRLPVILQKHRGVALPVSVVVNAAAAEAELRHSLHKIPKVRNGVI